LVAALAAGLMVLVLGVSSAHAQTTVTAAWDPNTDAYTAGYRLYYGTAPGTYQWSVDAGNQTSAPIALSPGSVYYFTVRAYTAQYEQGPASTEATIDLRSPAPTAQVTATMQSSNTALVSWQTTNATSANINGVTVGASGSTTVTVTSPTTFTLTATAADGRTATASASVDPATATAPTAQITATLGANNVATVSWQTTNATAANINGIAVGASGSTTVSVTTQTTFVLTATAADGRTATASATVTPVAIPAPTAQISATLGANNVATVTWATTNAVNANINGTAVGASGTASVTVTTQTTFTLTATGADGRTATASATVTPVAAPAPTAQITATLQANNTALVSWQTANAATATINGNAVALSGSSSVAVTATTTFSITAHASDGRTATSSATVTVPTATAPGYPRALTATVSGSRATFAWLAPNTGGAPTHYLLYVGTASGRSDIANGYNVGNVLSVYGDLPRGTYYARVRAANTAGTSLNSNEVQFTIGRKLRKPGNFTVTWTGTTATMTWTASAADAAEDEATNYVIVAGTAPGASNVARVNVGNTTTFSTEVPSGTYYVRVIAQNELGESDPSDEIEVRTPGTPQAPTALYQLGSGSTVDLRWTASAGGYAPSGYVIEAGSAPGRSDLAVLQVGDVTRFVTSAPPGTYYVRVRALNARGTSLPSNEIVVRR
jgi:hypothetical protein